MVKATKRTVKKAPAKAKAKAKPKAKPKAKAIAKPKAKATAKPKAKAKPIAKPKAAATPPSPAPSAFSAAAIAAHFNVTLPDRLRAFLDGEYAQHNERFVDGLPGLGGRRQLVFDAPKLLTIFRTNGVKIESKIPLAALRGEPELLTVDVSDPACPVGLWDSGAFLRFVPSLDALLQRLEGDPPAERGAFDEASELADDGD